MFALLLFFSYCVGGIPFAKIFAHRAGIDIQQVGSGNIGFANVLRNLGWKYAFPTLVGDVTKGAVVVLLALYLGYSEPQAYVVGVAALLGHVFCIYLRFRGGKGVATGLGVMCIIEPLAALAGSVVYAWLLFRKKESSVASVLALATLSAAGIALTPAYWWMYALYWLIAVYTFRNNIQEWRHAPAA